MSEPLNYPLNLYVVKDTGMVIDVVINTAKALQDTLNLCRTLEFTPFVEDATHGNFNVVPDSHGGYVFIPICRLSTQEFKDSVSV